MSRWKCRQTGLRSVLENMPFHLIDFGYRVCNRESSVHLSAIAELCLWRITFTSCPRYFGRVVFGFHKSVIISENNVPPQAVTMMFYPQPHPSQIPCLACHNISMTSQLTPANRFRPQVITPKFICRHNSFPAGKLYALFSLQFDTCMMNWVTHWLSWIESGTLTIIRLRHRYHPHGTLHPFEGMESPFGVARRMGSKDAVNPYLSSDIWSCADALTQCS
jgi:hypothetical protein